MTAIFGTTTSLPSSLRPPPRAGAVKFGWVEDFIQGNGTGIPGNPGGCKTICPWMPTFDYPRDPYQFGKNYQRVLLQRVPNHLRNSRNSSMCFSTPRKRNFRGRQLKIGGRKPRKKTPIFPNAGAPKSLTRAGKDSPGASCSRREGRRSRCRCGAPRRRGFYIPAGELMTPD